MHVNEQVVEGRVFRFAYIQKTTNTPKFKQTSTKDILILFHILYTTGRKYQESDLDLDFVE